MYPEPQQLTLYNLLIKFKNCTCKFSPRSMIDFQPTDMINMRGAIEVARGMSQFINNNTYESRLLSLYYKFYHPITKILSDQSLSEKEFKELIDLFFKTAITEDAINPDKFLICSFLDKIDQKKLQHYFKNNSFEGDKQKIKTLLLQQLESKIDPKDTEPLLFLGYEYSKIFKLVDFIIPLAQVGGRDDLIFKNSPETSTLKTLCDAMEIEQKDFIDFCNTLKELGLKCSDLIRAITEKNPKIQPLKEEELQRADKFLDHLYNRACNPYNPSHQFKFSPSFENNLKQGFQALRKKNLGLVTK